MSSVLYLSQDNVPGTANTINVQKWIFGGTSWSQQTTFYPVLSGSSVRTRGLTAFVTPDREIRIVATTNDSRLVTFIDDGTDSPAVTVLSASPSNTAYRGVAPNPAP